LFNFERFTELPGPRDLTRIFDAEEYAAWKAFRESEDSRYVALTLPRVLARLPYGENFVKVDEFNFEESVDGKDHDKYLWMSAAWAYAARCTDAFAMYGWLERIRGVDSGGKVEGLPVHTFNTADGEIAMKCSTEIAVNDRREFELSNLGFLPLVHFKGRNFAAFLEARSCHKPKESADEVEHENSRRSAQINYLLCASRFVRYLEVLAREALGRFMYIDKAKRWLNEWLLQYVLADPGNATHENRARYPLAAGRITFRPVRGRPGWCEIEGELGLITDSGDTVRHSFRVELERR
jgi:type VI secretion system protein ImpC